MHKDISPEEKLLSIIKGKRNKTADALAPKAEEKGSDTATAALQASKIDDYIAALLKNNFLKNNIFDPGALKVFNKYMIIILIITTLYFFIDLLLVNPSHKAADTISRVSASRMLTPLAREALPIETRNYSHYSNKITGKNTFSSASYGQSESQESGAASGEPADGNLGLVGIVPGENPQAIIEDKKNQKTYYLSKGQSANDITVQEIKEDKTILEYKGKRVTLFL